MDTQQTTSVFDYLFGGAGASAILLLMSLDRRGLLRGKKVIFVDPDTKRVNDKTYCFWANPEDPEMLVCDQLISQRWSHMRVDGNDPEPLNPARYCHISSIDLYHAYSTIIQHYEIEHLAEKVNTLEQTEKNVTVRTDSRILQASIVFDCRPPKFAPAEGNEVFLLQSFKGFIIRPESGCADTTCIDLMDFNVDQQGWTQFVYTLPLDENKLLVELTRFGATIITDEEADPLLKLYISNRFGSHTLIDTETGCIPMSSVKILPTGNRCIIPIGGRAGAVKPSTGYAFKTMLKHAESVAHALQSGSPAVAVKRSTRFRFYDRLLLWILSHRPNQGKPIFQALFQKNRINDVLKFLDERTSIAEEIRILLSLPLQPFLWSLWNDIRYRLSVRKKPLLLLLFSLTLWAISAISSDLFDIIQPIWIMLGLLLVGIPHGAVDHLAGVQKSGFAGRAGFITTYIGIMIAFFLLWMTLPNLALVTFILYSAWHFGQNDLREWKITYRTPLPVWAWGLSVLSILLFGHTEETNCILQDMNTRTLPFGPETGTTLMALLLATLLLWAAAKRHTGMMLCSLMLATGTQLPLISAFAIYFIGQHSLNGWSHLKTGMNLSDRVLYLKALPFTAGAIILFAVLVAGIKLGLINLSDKHLVSSFFIFLSCISLPHVVTMNRFYKKSQDIRKMYN